MLRVSLHDEDGRGSRHAGKRRFIVTLVGADLVSLMTCEFGCVAGLDNSHSSHLLSAVEGFGLQHLSPLSARRASRHG